MPEFDLTLVSLYILIFLLFVSVYLNIKQKLIFNKSEQSNLVLIKKAYFDTVSQLPNRSNLDIILNEQIARAVRHKKSFFLAVIRIGNYNSISSRSKERASNVILDSSNRLSGSIRNEDTLSRISDNSFAIVFNEYLEEENLSIITDRITTAFEEKFYDDKNSFKIEITIGISKYPDDATEINELINEAIKKALN
ncbi:MAG: diguanylate cyclase (GGDEF)-like protein [Sulfurimonas sp.]|jgi:diguanylate cyclase (GGDEF)-like protein